MTAGPRMTTTEETTPEVAVGETVLQQLARTYFDVLAAFERTLGISRARWQVLSLLAREQDVSQADLALRLRVDGAAVTRQVKQLEEEGLVRRWADPRDNRFTRVALTDAGRGLAASLISGRDAFEAQATRGLHPGDIEVMQRCLAQLRANVSGDPAAGSPPANDVQRGEAPPNLLQL